MTDIRELSITELDVVSGGMDCKTAIAVRETYILAAAALQALGDNLGSQRMQGKSDGVGEGAHPC